MQALWLAPGHSNHASHFWLFQPELEGAWIHWMSCSCMKTNCLYYGADGKNRDFLFNYIVRSRVLWSICCYLDGSCLPISTIAHQTAPIASGAVYNKRNKRKPANWHQSEVHEMWWCNRDLYSFEMFLIILKSAFRCYVIAACCNYVI